MGKTQGVDLKGRSADIESGKTVIIPRAYRAKKGLSFAPGGTGARTVRQPDSPVRKRERAVELCLQVYDDGEHVDAFPPITEDDKRRMQNRINILSNMPGFDKENKDLNGRPLPKMVPKTTKPLVDIKVLMSCSDTRCWDMYKYKSYDM